VAYKYVGPTYEKLRTKTHIVAILLLIGFILSSELGLFEDLASFNQAYPTLYIDEVIGGLVWSALAFFCITVRAKPAEPFAALDQVSIRSSRRLFPLERAIIVGAFAGGFWVMAKFSIFERILALDLAHPAWRVDDWAFGCVLAALGLAWLASRRARELVVLRAIATYSVALEQSNRQLASRAKALEEMTEDLARACEAAKTADRLKTEILGNMSHELRTPLNAVIGFSELISGETHGPLQPSYKEYADIIGTSARELLRLLGDLLELSKIKSEAAVPRHELADLTELVNSSVGKFRAEAAATGIALSIEQPTALLAAIDTSMLGRLISSLLSNAVKFTPAGGKIDVRLAPISGGGKWIEISISDTGIGMTEAEIAKALQPFGQVDGSATRRYQGAGLGLALAKAIAEFHGGELAVTSAPGQGTAVSVRLPVLAPTADLGSLAADAMQMSA